MQRVLGSVTPFLVAMLLAPGTSAQVAGTPPFTVDEMLRVKRVADPQLSPDGSRIAYVVTEADQKSNVIRSHIWISSVNGGEPVRFAASEKAEHTPRWSPDGAQLAFVSTRDGSSQIWSMSLRDWSRALAGTTVRARQPAMPRRLTSLATEAAGVRWSPDSRWIVFTSDVYPDCDSIECNERKLKEQQMSMVAVRVLDRLLFRHWVSWKEGRFTHLFLVPADGSAQPRDLTPGADDVPPFSLGGPDDYAFAPDSKEIAFVRKTDRIEAISTNTDIFVLRLDQPGAAPRKITENPAADAGPAYSPDGRFIAYRAQERPGHEADRWQLMLWDRQSGTHRSVTPAYDRWVESYTWTPDSKAIYLTAEEQGVRQILRVDLPVTTPPRPVVADQSNADVQITADGRMLVFSRSSFKDPVEIFRARADGTGMEPVTRTNTAMMARFSLRAGESVWWQGADGKRIQGWIVKPANLDERRRYPLLCIVHGGPEASKYDSWGYTWNPQVFASAGYVVFLPNARGSTGFGQEFIDEISGDWGGKIYEDLMKGIDYVSTLPYVDGARVGAAGNSFGGYMMNWFLGHTGRFKAIVSHAGIFNLTSMYGVTEELWFPEWEWKGTPWTNPDLYDRLSPHRYAQQFRTPTLVIHGELDFRVPIGEGLQLFTTLQRLGVPSKMLYFPDEGHWINKPANSALWYRVVLDWLNQWVKGEQGQPK